MEDVTEHFRSEGYAMLPVKALSYDRYVDHTQTTCYNHDFPYFLHIVWYIRVLFLKIPASHDAEFFKPLVLKNYKIYEFPFTIKAVLCLLTLC